jgi:hypothetical protein
MMKSTGAPVRPLVFAGTPQDNEKNMALQPKQTNLFDILAGFLVGTVAVWIGINLDGQAQTIYACSLIAWAIFRCSR